MAAEETPTEGQIQDTPEGQPTAENTPDEGGGVSPTTQVEDWSSKAQALEERLARQEERNRYLEQTQRLLEENARRSYQPPAPQEANLSPELAELDKTLDPLFSKRLKSQLDPLGNNMAAIMDGNDSLKFEMYLMRNHPEVLDNEDSMNRTFQQVEQVRQQAAQVYGKYLSRVDAFLYAQGLEGVREKTKARKTKKSTQVTEEAKRQLQVQATQSGENRPEVKRGNAGADIDAIRRKMMSGEKTTPEEKARFRKHLENGAF